MRRYRPDRRSFFSQGMLILLPALVLGVAGLYLLYADRALVRHRAEDRAQKAASTLLRERLPEAFQAAPTDGQRALEKAGEQSNDPISMAFSQAFTAGKMDRLLFKLAPNGELTYPPPVASPRLEAEDVASNLAAAQRKQWRAATSLLRQNKSLREAARIWRRLLTAELGPETAAQAHFRLGVTLKRRGEWPEAQRQFQRIIDKMPTVPGETGLPLAAYCHLSLLELLPKQENAEKKWRQWLKQRAPQVLLRPTDLTPLIWRKAAEIESRIHGGPTSKETGSSAPRWTLKDLRYLWQQQQRARVIHAAWRSKLGTREANGSRDNLIDWRWVSSSDDGFLVVPQREQSGDWYAAFAESSVVARVERAVSKLSLPPHFGMSVTIAERSVRSVSNDAVLLTDQTTIGNREPPAAMSASVFLTKPAGGYAEQRRRSLWFGGLLAASMAAVGIGFVTARRAFYRERRLSEMKSNFVSSVSHEMRRR